MAVESISRQNMYLCALVLLVIISANLVQSEFFNNVIQCSGKKTCSECIQTRGCAWCAQPDFNNRCFQNNTSPLTGSCQEPYIFSPSNDLKIIQAQELTRRVESIGGGGGGGYEEDLYQQHQSKGSHYHGGYEQELHTQSKQTQYSGSHRQVSESVKYGYHEESGRIVQIYPQVVDLKLRLNEAHRLAIQYSAAQDYPVDLYYLMDLSKSMEDDKDKLSKLGDQLSDTMRKLTSNFRLGFGSFVDKVLMPYVSTVPKKLEHPCEGCEAPYGFKNQMSLSQNTTQFSYKVNATAVSGNLDAPEGGFDAIMQSIVCGRQIGWRDQNVRKLLVFSTDAGFHYAGDGKLGGVITPNDGQCHLNENGEYTHSSILDYPSISQLNMKVKENRINIIFAVTASQKSVYEKLSTHIEGSKCATLSEDSSNIINIIKDEYSKISSEIEMKDNSTSDVKITYRSSCLTNGPEIETRKCEGVRVGQKVTFSAEIELVQCPPNPKDWFQKIRIYPVGINENLIINLEMLCGCACERPGHPLFQHFSANCSGHGTLKCGICDCDDSHFGRQCECSSTEVHSETGRSTDCRPANATIDCNGKGQCVCGVCECDKRDNPDEVISGKYCECDNFSCVRDKGLLCGGEDHGTCVCGDCECKPGWTGPDCTCRASKDTCYSKPGELECSGHGTCVCGECKCEETPEGRYSGRFCEKCPTCQGRCIEFRDCVQCQMYKTGPMGDNKDACAANCTTFVPIGAETVVANEDNGDHFCLFYDENDCRFEFIYNDYDINNITVIAKEKLECPTEIFILGIVMGVIASIVLIGLALLFLWKILTTIHDRREFAKFEKERRSAKWDAGENPIYKQATSTFKNPTYNGGR